VTASNSLTLEDGSEIVATGVVKFNLVARGAIRPYVTAGGGVTKQRGAFPVATVDGAYNFRLIAILPFDERDHVTLTQTFDESVPVGVVGGGVNLHLRSSSGIRVDVRALIGGSEDRVLLDATPALVTSATFGAPISSATNPSISFNNLPQQQSIVLGAPPSSLSGPAIDDFVSFESNKTRTQVTWSVGYFFRF